MEQFLALNLMMPLKSLKF